MMLASPRFLRSAGIVGMNERNIDLIAEHNPRHLYPLVDDKLKTKILAGQHGVATPELIGAIYTQHDLVELADFLEPHGGFAIKPAKGSGGKGIMVIAAQRDGLFIKTNGIELTLDDVQRHVSNVLSGLFSLGGSPDVAVVEALIEPDPVYKNLSVEGVPDIRVIVYRGFPVMTMMRLSTRASDGKANLHQGAIGLGLALASGRPVNAVQFNRALTHHPDSGADLREVALPDWPELLALAARAADACGLGYLGADIVIDRNRGPLLLELNARPGLAIQIANRAGLAPRIAAIDALPAAAFQQDPAARTRQSMALFPDAACFGEIDPQISLDLIN